MLKVFVPESLPSIRQLPLLEDARADDQRLFQHIPQEEFAGIIQLVPDIGAAAYLLVPHNLGDLRGQAAYLDRVLGEARATGTHAILFANQDDPSPIDYPDTIVLRPSLYRSKRLPHEIVMPGQIEDLGAAHGHAPRPKGERPSIGFMGKAGFDSAKAALRYYVRNYIVRHGPEREGMYFRRRALGLLRRDPRFDLTATARKRFSAHARTIEVPPEQARREYIESIKNCLFTLAPRGDGNYSLRFYEALSLGRIPVLIDTDMILPLADRIAYDEFMVRVPSGRLAELPDILFEFWQSHSEEELRSMQEKARQAFELLHVPAFLRTVLTEAFLASYA